MSSPEKLREMRLDLLALRLGSAPGSYEHTIALAEIRRREVLAGMEALEAEKRAAAAAAETAQHTRNSARYIFWSVLAILFASAVDAIVTVWAWGASVPN